MNRRGFFRSLLGLCGLAAGAPLLPKAPAVPVLRNMVVMRHQWYWPGQADDGTPVTFGYTGYDAVSLDQAMEHAAEVFGIPAKHFHSSDGRLL